MLPPDYTRISGHQSCLHLPFPRDQTLPATPSFPSHVYSNSTALRTSSMREATQSTPYTPLQHVYQPTPRAPPLFPPQLHSLPRRSPALPYLSPTLPTHTAIYCYRRWIPTTPADSPIFRIIILHLSPSSHVPLHHLQAPPLTFSEP